MEHDTERCFLLQTFEKRLFGFPDGGIRLDRNPVRSVSSIQYRPEDDPGTPITLDPSRYEFEESHRAVFPIGEPWPGVTTNGSPTAVVVTFSAGHGAADQVVAELKRAALVALTIRFYNEDLEAQYQDIIRPLRRFSYP